MTAPATAGLLFDTNVISELRKDSAANPRVTAWYRSVDLSACNVSAVSIAEIRIGIEILDDPGRRAELMTWLEAVQTILFLHRVIPVDDPILLAWRRLSRAGQKSGFSYSPPDALIAATALVHKLTVVTRNTRDFERAGVPLINPWAAPA